MKLLLFYLLFGSVIIFYKLILFYLSFVICFFPFSKLSREFSHIIIIDNRFYIIHNIETKQHIIDNRFRIVITFVVPHLQQTLLKDS